MGFVETLNLQGQLLSHVVQIYYHCFRSEELSSMLKETV